MADLSPTQAIYGSADLETVNNVLAGETLAVKDLVFKSTGNNKWLKLDVDDAARMLLVPVGKPRLIGIVMFGGGADGARTVVGVRGLIDLGAVLTAGAAYYGSDTAGKIRPAADNGSADHPVFVGTGKTTSLLFLDAIYHGFALA